MRVGPCIPTGVQLQNAEGGPTSGPTWRLSHYTDAQVRRAEEERGGLLEQVTYLVPHSIGIGNVALNKRLLEQLEREQRRVAELDHRLSEVGIVLIG